MNAAARLDQSELDAARIAEEAAVAPQKIVFDDGDFLRVARERATWPACAKCGIALDPATAPTCAECERAQLDAKRRVADILARAEIPDRYRWSRFGAPELAERVRDVVATDRVRRWSYLDRLVLGGPVPGVGKTSLAVASLVAAVNNTPRSALFVDCHALGVARGEYGKDAPVVTRALAAHYVVLDDLGVQRSTDDDQIARVVFDRHQRNKSTIVTTALSSDEIGRRFGGALQRRLLEGATLVRVEPGAPKTP